MGPHKATETQVFSWKTMVFIGVAEMSGKWCVLGASCGARPEMLLNITGQLPNGTGTGIEKPCCRKCFSDTFISIIPSACLLGVLHAAGRPYIVLTGISLNGSNRYPLTHREAS